MALLTASALGKTIRENDIDSLYYFYGHDTAALESFTKKLVNKLCPADAQVMNFHKLDGKNLDFSNAYRRLRSSAFYGRTCGGDYKRP